MEQWNVEGESNQISNAKLYNIKTSDMIIHNSLPLASFGFT